MRDGPRRLVIALGAVAVVVLAAGAYALPAYRDLQALRGDLFALREQVDDVREQRDGQADRQPAEQPDPEQPAPERAHSQSDPPWQLDRIDQRELPLDGEYVHARNGKGVRVYVVDNGVRASHTEFEGRVTSGHSTVGDSATDPADHHGTFMAGIVGARTHGAAKQATIVPCRFFDRIFAAGELYDFSPDGPMATAQRRQRECLEWIRDTHPATTPGVVVMAYPLFNVDGGRSDQLHAQTVRQVLDRGLSMTISAGNSTADQTTFDPPGFRGLPPEDLREEIVVVGATTSNDRRWGNSNWGSTVDVYAPGASVTSTSHSNDTATTSGSGTSYASPAVAGIMATYLEEDPSLTPLQIAQKVVADSTKGVLSGIRSGSHNRLSIQLVGRRNDGAAASSPSGGMPLVGRARRER